jgi:hypothetical protein
MKPPAEYKRAAFKHIVNRTAQLPTTPKAMHKEYKTMAMMAENNGYDLNKVTKRIATHSNNISEKKYKH